MTRSNPGSGRNLRIVGADCAADGGVAEVEKFADVLLGELAALLF